VRDSGGLDLAESTADQEGGAAAQSAANQSAGQSPGFDTGAQFYDNQSSVLSRHKVIPR